MRGGTGVLTSEVTSPVRPVCSPGAACSHSSVTGCQVLPRGSRWVSAGCRAPTPRAGCRRIVPQGSPGRAWRRTTGPTRAPNPSPTMRASHAVMEPRPMIHGGKRASCRCLEKPPGRSRYGWGPSCSGHSRVPFTTRGEATKSLSGRGGEGGVVDLCRGEPSVHSGRRA